MIDEYRGDRIIVRWDVLKCAHAGRCVKTLPRVFDAQKNPWVEPNAATPEEILAAVARCPSRALSAERINDEQNQKK